MTALPELLSTGAAGVYRVSAEVAAAAIERAAAAAGWRFVHLDTGDAPDKAAALAAIADAFEFPDWFGHNLDALADSLRDVTYEPGTLVLWDNPAGLAAADANTFRQIVAIFRNRAAWDDPALMITVLRGV